jgi:hypothetical protein
MKSYRSMVAGLIFAAAFAFPSSAGAPDLKPNHPVRLILGQRIDFTPAIALYQEIQQLESNLSSSWADKSELSKSRLPIARREFAKWKPFLLDGYRITEHNGVTVLRSLSNRTTLFAATNYTYYSGSSLSQICSFGVRIGTTVYGRKRLPLYDCGTPTK